MRTDNRCGGVKVGDTVYRVVDELRTELHGWGSTARVYVQSFTVEKVTPKGFWFSQGKPGDGIRGFPMWRSFNTRYAQRSVEGAANAALYRREFHIGRSETRLRGLRDRRDALARFLKEAP